MFPHIRTYFTLHKTIPMFLLVSDEAVFLILSSYKVPNLRYRTITPNIYKLVTRQKNSIKDYTVHNLCTYKCLMNPIY